MWHDVRHGFPGEKMFWISVLRRSVFDYVLYRGVRARSVDWRRANRFIFGGMKNEVGLSFDEVCSLFGWETEYIQRLTKKLTRADVRKLESRKFKDELYDRDRTVTRAQYGVLRWAPPHVPPFAVQRTLFTMEYWSLTYVPVVHWDCVGGA